MVLEQGSDALTQRVRRESNPIGLGPDPRKGRIQSFILDLQPTPRLETQGLPSRGGQLSQTLDPQELPALVGVASPWTLSFNNLPDLGNQRTGERLIVF